MYFKIMLVLAMTLIALPSPDYTCSKCGGSGTDPYTGKTCQICGGSGQNR